MNVVVLTTETLHHAFFVAELAKKHAIAKVFVETVSLAPSFDVGHPFEAERDRYELEQWFDGRQPSIADFAESSSCDSINEPAVIAEAEKMSPDAVVVFGTGRLKKRTIDAFGDSTINLHGGDPERYRGLDTHLWAIYHNDFAGLSTTLHKVNSKLDDGQIIANLPIPLRPGMKLYELRKANTEVCVRLTLECLKYAAETGSVTSRPQGSHGRYYSFMPTVLKEICRQKFERYTDTL